MTDIEIRRDIPFTDGVAVTADAYLPAGPGPHPVLLAIHGGAWQRGDKAFYQHLGPYWARKGIAVFSINYKLTTPSAPSFPQTPQDVAAALVYLKREAKALKIDPARVGVVGDSAGAHLASLLTLDGATYAKGADFAQPKVCIGIYGVYDMAAQWNHDLLHRPQDNITERFLGKPLYDDRRAYFDTSPLSHVTSKHNKVAFFLIWGTEDDICEPQTQSQPMLRALKQAGYYVRTHILTGAPHFWLPDPLEGSAGYSLRFAQAVDGFLREML